MRNAESLAYCFVRQQERLVTVERLREAMLRQYEPDFDTVNYSNFNRLSFLDSQVRQEEKAKLDAYTSFNLETMLGERFHVLLSERTDIVRDGKLYAPYSKEPLSDIFIRGQEYRRQNGSIPSDREREAAEVESFFRVEEVLADPATPDGTMCVVISQPGQAGTEYLHNFYDIYTKQGETVNYRRYSSALDDKETFARVLQLSPAFAATERSEDPAFLPDDVFFLRHPFFLAPSDSTLLTSDDVHVFFHAEHGSMGRDEFAYLLAATEGYKKAYIQVVSENPDDIRMRNLAYNAYLNKADEVALELRRQKETNQRLVFERGHTAMPTRAEMVALGSKPVREVTTGCGSSGGMSVAEILGQNSLRDVMRAAFGVVDFALLQLMGEVGYSFDQEGDCVTCGSKGNVGPCGICELCDRAIRRQQGMKAPVTISL